MANASRDPILLTPGPLTTALPTRVAMLRDWGSWDSNFNAITGADARALARDCVCVRLAHLRADAGQRDFRGGGGGKYAGAA